MILIPKYKNVVKLDGALSIVVTDTKANKIKQELYVPNLVVSAGKTFIASRMVGTTSAVMSHMGLGTDATQETDTNTTLIRELSVANGFTGYTRAGIANSLNANNTVTYVATFAANSPSAPVNGVELREAGIFNASTAGIMLCRTTFPIVTKMPADALTVTWTITVS